MVGKAHNVALFILSFMDFYLQEAELRHVHLAAILA